MKHTILTLIMLCMIPLFTKAQDLIILTNGDEISSLVKEIGVDVIKYNKFENPNGPLYSIEKSKVFMIKYQNGTKDIFTQPTTPQPAPTPNPNPNPVPPQQAKPKPIAPPTPLVVSSLGAKVMRNGNSIDNNTVIKLMSPYPMALSTFQKGVSQRAWGEFFSYASVGSMLMGLARAAKLGSNTDAGRYALMRWMGAGAFMWGFEIGLKSSGKKNIKNAVNIYNSNI